MAVSRRTLWLAAALAAAIIVATMVRSTADSPTPSARRTDPLQARSGLPGTAASRAGTQSDGTQSTPQVNLQQLSRERGEPTSRGRNPFRFEPKAPPPPPPSARPVQQATAPAMPPVPAGPPPPPPITLKFIGIVQKADGTRIAVLSDGKRPISGKEGDEIEGRYRILKIGTESVDVSYIDGRGRQTIRLTGQ